MIIIIYLNLKKDNQPFINSITHQKLCLNLRKSLKKL